MALTAVQSNNKLIQFTKEINREFVRTNLFSPYMGSSLNSIIRIKNELKSGGEQMNLPIVTKLTNQPIGVGTLVGQEENIDNYGMRVWLDWARNAVKTNAAEMQKDSADIFGEAKPLLSDWGRELQRDEIIAALHARPSESAPTNLGTTNGQRANGILYEVATATQNNTWASDNSDRVLYGALTSNYSGTHATDLAKITTAATDKFTYTNLSLMKRIAMNASPAIRPFKTMDGYEYYVAFAGSNTFRDLKLSLATVWQNAQPREKKDGNPLFQDGDVMFDGCIVRQVPEISGFVTDVWTSLTTAGATSTRVEPVFLCGQQAAAFCWGQMAKPTFLKEDDYGFVTGTGIQMAYGIAKMFKKHPLGSQAGTKLKDWGVVTGYFYGASD